MPKPDAARRELVLVGAGRMGSALLDGWIKAGLVTKSSPAEVIEPAPPESLRRRTSEGLAKLVSAANVDTARTKLVVLAVKPQVLDAALEVLKPLAESGAAFLSIAAGKTIASIASPLRGARGAPIIIRSMPNLPASVGAGVTAAVAGPGVDAALKAQADALLGAVGKVVWLDDESLLDAVTAISGSGPAYVFHLVEALAAAGLAIGLPKEAADSLARETIIGAAALLKASADSPAGLRQAVTSPGGTTEAALKVLMGEGGLTPLMRKAAEAALRRAKELGKG
ncbi:MAG TPA: pyrroline-5-carboxylate reductase [Alphaproteobacteria bacterium]|nr:pyrroline-5-carboxylate reductase [Alphaproteobacteria bacterium]